MMKSNVSTTSTFSNFNSSPMSLGECQSNQFQCHTNECISIIWACDGNKDCFDGSDEVNDFCSTHQCPAEYFRCNTTGQCIPNEWLQDGEPDCVDASDEKRCTTITNGTDCIFTNVICSHNEFQCANNRCVHLKFQCDGDDDCGDGSDELQSLTCSPSRNRMNSFSIQCDKGGDDQYRCANGLKCIPKSWICNGINDCAGGDDESSTLCNSTIEFGNKQINSDPTRCLVKDQFICNNGVCLDSHLLCNGENDCGDFSDESQCNVNECETKIVCAQKCQDMPIGYRCSCFDGFEMQDGGRICKDIDECKYLGV